MSAIDDELESQAAGPRHSSLAVVMIGLLFVSYGVAILGVDYASWNLYATDDVLRHRYANFLSGIGVFMTLGGIFWWLRLIGSGLLFSIASGQTVIFFYLNTLHHIVKDIPFLLRNRSIIDLSDRLTDEMTRGLFNATGAQYLVLTIAFWLAFAYLRFGRPFTWLGALFVISSHKGDPYEVNKE